MRRPSSRTASRCFFSAAARLASSVANTHSAWASSTAFAVISTRAGSIFFAIR